MHCGAVDLPPDIPILVATPEDADVLSKCGVVSRLLLVPVDPGRWVTADPQTLRYDDGALNILSLAPLNALAAESLVHIFSILHSRIRNSRLLVFEDAIGDFW